MTPFVGFLAETGYRSFDSVHAAPQERRNVARILPDRHNLDCVPVGAGAVSNKLGANCPETEPDKREVCPLVTDSRRAPNGFKCIEQLCDPLIGGVNTVGSDILPYSYIVEVQIRIGTENVIAHVRATDRTTP